MYDSISPYYWVADAINALVGGAEVGIAAQDCVVKQSCPGADPDICFTHEKLDELTVDPAPGIIHQLLDFQFVF